MLASLVLLAAILYLSISRSWRSASYAVPAALYISLSGAASWGFMLYSLTAGYRSRRGQELVAGALFASGVGVLALGTSRVTWHLAWPVAAAVAACAGIVSAAVYVFQTGRSARQALAWYPRRPADRRAAEDTYTASQRALGNKKTSAEQRKIARLNAARAAIMRSISDDAADGLVSATEELSDLLNDPPDSWLTTFSVVVELVDAVSIRAEKHGDLSGYPRALALLEAAARRTPPDMGAMAVVHYRRAEYHEAMRDRLEPGPAADAHAEAAIASLRAAIEATTRPMRGLLPDLHVDLGILMAYDRPGDLAAGMELCHTAFRLAGRSPRARVRPAYALANMLTDLAMETVDGLADDASDAEFAEAVATVADALGRAERLLRYARRRCGFDQRSVIAESLARTRAARTMFVDGPVRYHHAAEAWRAAARAGTGEDPLHRVRIGRQWVDWAEATRSPAWCAEAYAYLMSVVPPAVAVRYLAEERDRVLAGLQSTAEEAGYWLAEAGRSDDAAIALELGRAVSLSEVMGRERPGLPAALLAVGRPDLLMRYRTALDGYRSAMAAAAEKDLSSAPQRAWAVYDAAVREIAAAVNIDLPGAAPKLAELTLAASDGPVVYLAASSHGGYAIVLTADAPPAYWPLPGLAREAVAGHVEPFLRGASPDEVAAAVQWLWESGIRELARDLPTGALVTIVPMGRLGLLPVHAAGGPAAQGQAPEDWTYLADLVTVRYAPNARTLLRACDRAAGFAPDALELLAVAAPGGEPQRPLRYTVPEVTQIARRWARADVVPDGDPAAVHALLSDRTVWHVACHCQVIPDDILDSALLLAGARLSLRDILAMPPAPRRLAVLSACETHLSGTQLPDEAVGLPSGLLQAGFAGVVACHWPVIDRSTAFLMVRFYELWHGQGLPPAAALAEAQRWLRTATSEDIASCAEGLRAGPAKGPVPVRRHGQVPGVFGHPYFWAPFALTGQ
jgi:CHAT domain-containing protein